MVAPTRTPQARGVKCDLCKKILCLATWLDQKKLAKRIEDAQSVLALIDKHNNSHCPCIPKSIENLLVGSTHFEIHRLSIEELDRLVHNEHSILTKENKSKTTSTCINDCDDTKRDSRFKIFTSCFGVDHFRKINSMVLHLRSAIDYWTIAIEDPANPFNTKLALRLGLTHHVIYACYLFKFYKIFDYQLKTSVLLLNIFRSIEEVTANAVLHANFLLIRSLMDCAQFNLARQHLKKAIKMTNYHNRSHYESILLLCIECELKLLDERESDKLSILEELADLVAIKKDDKLQHYYARTLAMETIIKYIQHFPSRSDYCFEYFHTYRFTCAILRRCYEASFELVLSEKDLSRQQTDLSSSDAQTKQDQILDHSWIRFAVCDLSFTAFDILADFYIRAGMPEALELLYNGLSLIALRSGSIYWQTRMTCIGVEFDLLCDKLDTARAKLQTISWIKFYQGHLHDPILLNLLQLEFELGSLSFAAKQENFTVDKDVILDLFTRIKACRQLILDKVSLVSIYDCKTSSFSEIIVENASIDADYILVIDNPLLFKLGLNLLKVSITSLLRVNIESPDAYLLMRKASGQIVSGKLTTEFNNYQVLLEILVAFVDIARSDRQLLCAVIASDLFLRMHDDLNMIRNQVSSLSLASDKGKHMNQDSKCGRKLSPSISGVSSNRISRITWAARYGRKETYEVATISEENLCTRGRAISRMRDRWEIFRRFSSLSKEEILVAYLKHSEPNPNYLLYRKAHELMLSLRLSEEGDLDLEQIIYHFTESCSSNTMRYRWMMYEEQQVSPYDPTSPKPETGIDHAFGRTKNFSFCGSSSTPEKVVRSMLNRIPEECRLYQFKYIRDIRSETEHLLIVVLDSSNDYICIHTERNLTSDDFFNVDKCDSSALTIPNTVEKTIEECGESLKANNKVRFELRRKLEIDLGVILHDLENEWLGPYRFILCAKILETNYNNMIGVLIDEISGLMESEFAICYPIGALKMMLQGAPLLTRDEFCGVISTLYKCPPESQYPKLCYQKWLKTLENYIAEHQPGVSKTALLKTLSKGQIGIILDQYLDHIPFESLPTVRAIGQGIFRIPSLRLYSLFASRRCLPIKIDPNRVAYVLDPADNLAKTHERFNRKLKINKCWSGVIGQPPQSNQLESWLKEEQLYIFIGHGAGTVYYNKLCKGRGLGAMAHIKAACIVLGCSSGKVIAEGPRLESFGIGWAFVLRGAPCYLGLLWDVTDTDIDRYTDSLFSNWMPTRWPPSNSDKSKETNLREATHGSRNAISSCITDVSAVARNVCSLRLLVGSTPVVYGLPVYCNN